MNILEAKLSTKDRNELPAKEFGLPEHRKFPLNDEAHVKSAILFFKYAKADEKRELAKNINLKLKKFDMKVKVGKNNPFYKYIDRNHLVESIDTIQEEYIIQNDTYTKDFMINVLASGYYPDELRILEKQREQLENEIYIINKYKDFNLLKKDCFSSLYSFDDDAIKEKIDKLSGLISMNDIQAFVKQKITFELNTVDLVRLAKVKFIKSLHYGEFINNAKLWYGVSDQSFYILMKSLEDRLVTYKLLEIDEDTYKYLIQGNSAKCTSNLVTITFSDENDINYDTLSLMTEGFTVSEDGDIKISIDPKKSYMDEYSETHRILVENFKNKNYEAMKQNVAFMFLLISVIERDKKYKSRDPEVVKARAFAINDFKTYLSHIQKHQPSFNFEEYYRNSEFDKYIINVPKSTIVGIKNLLKTILL